MRAHRTLLLGRERLEIGALRDLFPARRPRLELEWHDVAAHALHGAARIAGVLDLHGDELHTRARRLFCPVATVLLHDRRGLAIGFQRETRDRVDRVAAGERLAQGTPFRIFHRIRLHLRSEREVLLGRHVHDVVGLGDRRGIESHEVAHRPAARLT